MARSSSLLALYRTRLREFYRQPARIFWVYGFPIVLALVLGLAFENRPQETIAVDLIEDSEAPELPETIGADAGTSESDETVTSPPRPRFVVVERPEAEALKRLRIGKTPLVVERTGSRGVHYHYDPTRPEAVAARAAFDDALQRGYGRTDPVETAEVVVDEPGARYIDFLIPGLMALNTMGGGLWGVGFLLVNFRIAGLLKRFMATPMPRRDFLMAILGARLTFLVPDVVILLALGTLKFGMPIRGSLFTLALLEIVGGLAFAGIGLLIASRAKTTETVSGLMNLTMIPMWLLSGVFFSNERYPAVMQPLIQALPLTQLASGLRAILLEGAGLVEITPALLILGAWALGTFALALRIFRWT